MCKSFSLPSGLILIVALVLSACNLPASNGTPEVTIPMEAVTATEPAATSTATEAIPTEPATATETPSPEPSATLTAAPPMAQVVRETNCRIGPGGLYELVAKYPVGQMLEVVAKDLGGGYWFVQNPEKLEEQCYLLAQNIKITGDTDLLPKFTPLPSPTAAPFDLPAVRLAKSLAVQHR